MTVPSGPRPWWGARIPLRFAAWEWGAHQDARNRALHLFAAVLSTSALLLLAAPVDVPVGSRALPLPLWIWGGVALGFAPLSPAAVAISTGLIAVTTAGFGALWPWQTTPLPILVLLVVVFLFGELLKALARHAYYDLHEEHMTGPPGGALLRRLHALLFAVPTFVLFRLVDGVPPDARRRRLDVAAARYFRSRTDPGWRNWQRTAEARPSVIHYPTTAEEVAAIVRDARRDGRKVRPVGTSFSWAALGATDDVLISLRYMRGVELDLSDPERPLAHVGPGATGAELNRLGAPAGVAMPTGVVLESVTWGGQFSAGAHGSGWNTQTVSDYVERVVLVTGTGEIRTIVQGEDPDELLRTVRVALGMAGVVCELTLRLTKNHNVRLTNRQVNTAELMATLQDVVPQHDYFDIYWWPGLDTTWVRTWDRTDEPLSPLRMQTLTEASGTRTSHWSYAWSWVQTYGARGLAWIMRKRPALTPMLMERQAALSPNWSRVVDLLSATHFRQGQEALPIGCIEFAFAIDSWDDVRRSWDMAREEMAVFEARGEYPMNMVLNLRFVAGSDAYLSPAGGNSRTCYIEALGDLHNPSWRPFAITLSKRWMTLPRSRPHWGKEWDFVPGIGEHVRAVFGEELEAFLAVRAELDPDGLFLSPLMEATFGVNAA